ncbi:MAG: ABC transporter substrate-binding protein [Desulfobacteraceae bacterium]|nr:ABC transporter substrate-binding protein [Desulfobacteraceae bacterium]
MYQIKGQSLLSVILGTMILFFLSMVPFDSLAIEKDHPILKHSWMRWDKEYWPTEPVRGGILHTASNEYIGLMNPYHWPVNDWVTIGNLYEQYVYVDGKYKANVPWIFRTWEYLDPKTVVTKIEKGIQFFDGSVMNAECIKYNFEWIMDKKSGTWARAYFKSIKSIEILDEYTIKWHFKKPWAGFIGSMNYMGYPISAKALKGDMALRAYEKLEAKLKKAKKAIAKAEKKAKRTAEKGGAKAQKAAAKLEKAIKKMKDLEKKAKIAAELAEGAKNLDLHPVGSGAYMLDEARPGNYLKLKRNPNWWFAKLIGKDMPYFDGMKVTVIPDPAIRLANLRAGKIDVLGIPKSQYNMIKDDPKLNVYVTPQSNTVALQFNHVKGPCQDIRVRKAISHAIDRKALIAGVQFGLAQIASGIYPGRHYCHNPSLKPVSFDPELSKRLLTEAGYSKGLTLTGYAGNDTESQTRVEAVKATLTQVGIEWKVDFLETAAATDRLKNLEYDLASGGWTYIFNPDSVATGLYHPEGSFNYGRSNNKKAVALIEAGLEETNREKRLKLYQELDKVLYDNYEDAWLWWSTGVVTYRKVIQGYNYEFDIQGGEGYGRSHHNWFIDGRRK